MLVDTDVLIFNQRGNEKTAEWLDSQPHITLSAVTWMELIQGVRNRQELRTLREALRYWGGSIMSAAGTRGAVLWLGGKVVATGGLEPPTSAL